MSKKVVIVIEHANSTRTVIKAKKFLFDIESNNIEVWPAKEDKGSVTINWDEVTSVRIINVEINNIVRKLETLHRHAKHGSFCQYDQNKRPHHVPDPTIEPPELTYVRENWQPKER